MDFFKFMFYTMGDRIYSYDTFFIIYKSLFKRLIKSLFKKYFKKNTLKAASIYRGLKEPYRLEHIKNIF